MGKSNLQTIMSYKMIAHNTISSLIPEAQGGEETVDKNIPEENNSNANEEDNINNEPNVPLTESQNDELKKIAIAHGEGEEGWSDENDYEQPATPEAAGAVGEDGVPTADEPGGIQGMDLPTIESLSVPQQMCLDRAKKYAMEQSIRQVLINQELQTKEYTESCENYETAGFGLYVSCLYRISLLRSPRGTTPPIIRSVRAHQTLQYVTGPANRKTQRICFLRIRNARSLPVSNRTNERSFTRRSCNQNRSTDKHASIDAYRGTTSSRLSKIQ